MKKLLFMLAVLVSMLSPSVGWATTFIKDVAVSIDKNEQTAKKALTNKGYTVVNTDLNAGCGSDSYYVYVGYTTTTNAAEAITDLIIAHNYSPSSDSFTWSYTGKFYRIATNVLENGNLNRGQGSGSANLWLYYSKTGNTTNGQSLVTSIYGHIGASSSSEYLVGVTSSTAKPEGSIDLNMGAGGKYVYLGQKKEHTHSFSYWNYTTDNHRYGCASCGYVESTTAHNWSNSGAKIQDQTCTTAEVRYQTCTNCGHKNDANHTYIAGNALGHSFDEVNDPHHTNCTRCKHTFFRYQSKDGNVVKPYSNNFGEAQILSNTYTNGEGVIEFDRTLTTIGENAFFYCYGLTGDLVIPNSVTSIGEYAFFECKGLTGNLVIPNSVTSIGKYAFDNCSGLTGNLEIPNSVTSIGNNAFYYCSGFNGNLSIGNSVTSIGEYAFFECTGFNGTLSIGNSVISIGNYAFCDCSGFTGDLVIPNSVTSIGQQAFYSCSGFNGNLSIGNSVTSIGEYAFFKCTGFNGTLSIGNSVISIGNYAFCDCTGLTGNLVIPNSVTSIGEYAFFECTGLKNVLFLGDKPETMRTSVFCEDNLTLYVKDLSQWDTNEMYEARRLTYKTWKEYCEEVIGEHDLDENCTCSFCGSKIHTFADEDTHHDFCTQCEHTFFRYQSEDGNVVEPFQNNFGKAQIVSNTYTNGEGVIEFDRTLTTIGEYAFRDCSGFTGDLVIPNSVTSIGNYAFYSCSGFTGDLIIPNSVTSIGISAFNWCSGFTGDLVIPNSVTSIGSYAFYKCSGLTGNLVIPNSVTSIEEYAFYGCSGLKNVLFLGDKPETMGESVFCEDSLTLYVKDLSQWDTNEMYDAKSLTYKTWKEYCEEVIGEHDLDENCTCNFCGSIFHTFADEDKHHDFCTQCKHGFFRYQSKDGNVVKPANNNFGEAQIESNTYANGEGVIEFDRKLTTIGDDAFYGCSGFTGDLVIPNSVTSIGNYAFEYCFGFNGKLSIGNSVTSIGNFAFYECTGLTGDLVIPNSVTSIGTSAFEYCYGFNGNLSIGNSVTSIGNFAFRVCDGLTGDLVIPNSVTSIGNFAFDYCKGLTGNLEIPNSVTSIGNYAFRDCSGFTGDLVIPNSVISIGDGAFVNCSGLKNVLFLGDKPTMGAIAFRDDNLTLYVKDLSQWDTNEMYDAESLTYKTWKEYCEEVIGEHDLDENCTCSFCGSKIHTFADEDTHHDFCTQCKHGFFRYQSKDGNVVKPYSNNFGEAQIVSNTYAEGEGVIEFDRKLTTIGNFAFYNRSGLTGDLVIPNTVTSIGNDVFYECSGFNGTLSIGNSVTSIGNYAFYECSGFTGDLVIPNSVTSIGERAFYNCSGFTGDLVIPNSVTSIGEDAFSECSGFTGDLVIPNSVTSIGEYAFFECTGFNGTLSIGNSVISIRNYAFDNCSGLTGNLVIPNSVTSIGKYAFKYCTGLTGNLVIPNSVTSIGEYAFFECTGLKNVLFLGKPETMGIGVFYGDTLTLYVKDLSQWDTNEMYGAESLTYKTLKEYCEEVIGEHDLDENCTCSFCGSKFHTFADEDTHHDFCTQCKHGFFRYQSEEGNVVEPYRNNFGEAQIVSNTYAEGEGVIEFDRKLTTIGDRAFYDRYGLTGDLVIPNTVTSIGEGAFFNCTGFNGTLSIGNSVTSIGNAAFCSCYGFTNNLEIPNSVTSIGFQAFVGCWGLTGVVISNSVTRIENNTFVGCESLTSVVIPNSVTSIGEGAFADCYSLQSVEIASLPRFGRDAFYDVPCGISVALTDESYVCGEKEFDDSELPSLQSASYTRQMTNEWGTLVLPFGIDYLPENGNYRLYRLERVENQTLLLGEYAEGNIPAGTPVVVKAVGEKDSKGKYTLNIQQNQPTLGTKVQTEECDNCGWCMKGTLEPMTAAAGAQFYPAGMNVYYIAQNQFWYANQAFDMARFRAWFEAPASVDASAMRFQIMEVEETGIHTCAAGEKAESSFDLQGRRMSAPAKGLQIINGRKVLKK